MMHAGLNWDWVELLIFCSYDVGGWILKLNYAIKGFSIDVKTVVNTDFPFQIFIYSRVSFVLFLHVQWETILLPFVSATLLVSATLQLPDICLSGV